MGHKDIRKIVDIGRSSCGVILPKGWLRFYNLKSKDRVEVISNGAIIIKPLREDDESES